MRGKTVKLIRKLALATNSDFDGMKKFWKGLNHIEKGKGRREAEALFQQKREEKEDVVQEEIHNPLAAG